jgi:hypothetical protein
MTELERCDEEIRQLELLLRGGHPDMEGLLLALADWLTERRLLIEAGEELNEWHSAEPQQR